MLEIINTDYNENANFPYFNPILKLYHLILDLNFVNCYN